MIRLFCMVLAFGALITAKSVQAQNSDAFVRANLLSVLYHELGHAIIDVDGLPVFGQEEDAADVASILLIDALFDEDAAVDIAYEAAFGFLAEAQINAGEPPAWWDVHGPDLQRYYTLVCLFVGADMTERADIAQDLGLPQERQDTCEEEFDLANDSWGAVWDELAKAAPGTSLIYDGPQTTLTETLVAQEVAALNADFVLPHPLRVTVENCGEVNAFYDPQTTEIIICAEFEQWLRRLPVDD